MNGHQAPYAAVPWFWSDQADWKFQIAGLAVPGATSVTSGEDTVLRFSVDRLSAVETINNPKVHMKARKLLAQETVPTYSDLAARNFDLAMF